MLTLYKVIFAYLTTMKKLTLKLMFLVSAFTGYTQATEFSARLNSGFFYFSGESVESTTHINYNLTEEDGYTNNPYGNRATLSYGFSANLNRITKSNFRMSVDIGYEVLRSKIDINMVSLWDGSNATSEVAEGQTFFKNSFVNFYPSMGYRLTIKSYNLDFDIGLDVAKNLSNIDKGQAESNTRTYEVERERSTINSDIKGRYQLTISKNKMGGYLGFSNGMKNYKEGFAGGVNLAFSRMIRFGLVYKLK